MSNIIRFPEPRPASAQMPRDKGAGMHSAEILFFTGIRYSRPEPRRTGEGEASKRLPSRSREKIEA